MGAPHLNRVQCGLLVYEGLQRLLSIIIKQATTAHALTLTVVS